MFSADTTASESVEVNARHLGWGSSGDGSLEEISRSMNAVRVDHKMSQLGFVSHDKVEVGGLLLTLPIPHGVSSECADAKRLPNPDGVTNIW